MSHFVTIVLAPKETGNVGEYLSEVLEPYNENTEVPEYEQECYCKRSNTRDKVNEASNAKFPTWGQLKEDYRAREEAQKLEPFSDEAQKLWMGFTREKREFEEQLEKELYPETLPTEDCEDCNGTGKHPTTYNPKSKWDWYVVGGRWTGLFSKDYDPAKDPENIETCMVCAGSGSRDDKLGRDARAKDPSYKCNGCQGEGKSVKWPTQWADHSGDIVPANKWLSLLDGDAKEFTPFAIVTPDGEWHEKGKMGWWACVFDEKDKDEWRGQTAELVQKHANDHIAIVVDCHL